MTFHGLIQAVVDMALFGSLCLSLWWMGTGIGLFVKLWTERHPKKVLTPQFLQQVANEAMKDPDQGP